MKRSIQYSFLLLFISFTAKLQAQSCFNVSAGNDTSISCLQSCLNLKARIPDLRTSETYQVTSIPYTPYAYVTPGGTTDPLVNADDHFSDSFFLPFPFCFYGNTYNKICVGSNGVITFDVKTNANTEEGYFMDPGDTLPNSSGVPNNFANFYAPRASIFLAYYDMNPATSPAGSKIEWRVEGFAPCRRFVVSFYRISNYALLNCPDFPPTGGSNLCTMQAVLYEGSGIIDVFYLNKPACTGYQGGLAIAGVQNWNQDQAVIPPGKNGTVWTAKNEGIRYVPSGATSLLDSVVLYKNGVKVTAGTTTALGNGELEATFSNVCQPEDSMSYVVRAFYRQCDNSAIETEGSDTIIVYKGLNIITDVIDAPCNANLGKITIVSPAGPTVEYSIDGGANWQAFNVFNEPAGTYTIIARVIGSVCTGSTTITITAPPVFAAFATTTADANCYNNNGSISVTASGGTTPYQYSNNGGASWQPLNVFPNLPAGNYSIVAKDAHNCQAIFPAVVALIDTMRLELGPDISLCSGSSVTIPTQTNAETNIFKWTPAAGLNSDIFKNPVALPNDTTRYILTAKWGICQRKDTVTINVLHKPVIYAGKDTAVCFKTNALLIGSAVNLSGTVNYSWSPADSLNTPNAANTIARMDTTRQFKLTVTDNYGCSFSITDSVLVTMQPPLIVFAGNDTNAVRGKPHQLLATGGSNYLWSPAGPLTNSFIANPLATLYNDTYFTVLVKDAIGCTATDDVFIKTYEGPTYYLPNAFTPNGDGLNDIFRPIPVGIRSTEYFRIFNRYGALMFETRQWMQGWDGTIKGKPAAAGTYAWVIKGIDKNGRIVDMTGTVILIK